MMIYLDNAATTFPKPAEVYDKTFQFMKEGGGNPGRGGHYFSSGSAQVVENTRRLIAQFFGVKDFRRVVFTYNCTDSVNIVLHGYLKEKDHVIATNLDHNSVSRPLESLRQRRGLEVTRLPFESDGMIDPQKLRSAMRTNTTLVVINHGSNVLGVVQNLNELVPDGVPVLVDAAQTAGRVRLQLEERRMFVAFSAHKSLFGMPGLGVLIVPEGIEIATWREGGSGTASESLEHPNELPMHLEAGTPNFMSIAALSCGLEFIERTGREAIHRREWLLAKRLFDFLRGDRRFIVYSRMQEADLAIVAFNIRGVSAPEAATILDQRFGISVRAGLHCAAVLHQQLGTVPDGCLRVSPGFFNIEPDIATLLEAIDQIATAYS